MSIIEATSVTRQYGKGKNAFTAVDNISLSVEQGELVALLGTNGAGKTSLTEILQGTAAPTHGQVRLFGADPISERHRVRPRTGIMLQEAGFADDLTVRETLRMWRGTMAYGYTVDEIMEIVELNARADVRIKALSGGEKRRLDLAMATLGRPDLLFLDEPTTGLDPASRRNTWDLVTAMMKDGTTIFLTTHYLEEAQSLADRVMIMSRGQILMQGSVDSIISQQPSTISFSLAHTELNETELRSLPGLVEKPTSDKKRITLHTNDLQTTLSALLNIANARNIHLESLEARSASLEQAFLSLTSGI